jgi:capsular exopolysaccharide synthesis family protein
VFLATQLLTPVYETSTTLLVINSPRNEAQDFGAVQASQSLAGTYSDLLLEDAMLQEVITRLGLPTNPTLLAKSIKVTPVRSSQRIVVTVEGTDPAQIANIGNTLIAVFIEKITQIQADRFISSKDKLQNELATLDGSIQTALASKNSTQNQAEIDQLDGQIAQLREMYATTLNDLNETRLAEAQSTADVVQISKAGISYTNAGPNPWLIILLAGVLGMTLAAGYVLVRNALDKTLKTPEDVTNNLDLPVVGVIYKHTEKNHPIIEAKPNTPAAEAFRLLGAKIGYDGSKSAARTILVTSPTRVHGKSNVSANLAMVLSQGDDCVTLIDTDLSNPEVHRKFDLQNTSGLADLLLVGQPGLAKPGFVQKVPKGNLSIITTGKNQISNRSLLTSNKFKEIVEDLMVENQYVIIDTAPVLQMAETVSLSTMVDGLLLVIQAGQTTLAEAKQAVENLQWVNAKIIGVVLYNADVKPPHQFGYIQNGKN